MSFFPIKYQYVNKFATVYDNTNLPHTRQFGMHQTQHFAQGNAMKRSIFLMFLSLLTACGLSDQSSKTKDVKAEYGEIFKDGKSVKLHFYKIKDKMYVLYQERTRQGLSIDVQEKTVWIPEEQFWDIATFAEGTSTFSDNFRSGIGKYFIGKLREHFRYDERHRSEIRLYVENEFKEVLQHFGTEVLIYGQKHKTIIDSDQMVDLSKAPQKVSALSRLIQRAMKAKISLPLKAIEENLSPEEYLVFESWYASR